MEEFTGLKITAQPSGSVYFYPDSGGLDQWSSWVDDLIEEKQTGTLTFEPITFPSLYEYMNYTAKYTA